MADCLSLLVIRYGSETEDRDNVPSEHAAIFWRSQQMQRAKRKLETYYTDFFAPHKGYSALCARLLFGFAEARCLNDAVDIMPFLLLVLVMELTPGPNMAYLALLSTTQGRRAGLVASAGVAAGLLALAFIAAQGLATALEVRPEIYQLLRWLGIGYLLWLAMESWFNNLAPYGEAPILAEWRYFRRGIITNLLNPKALVFYVTVLPGFAGEKSTYPTLILSLIHVLVASLIHVLIVLTASGARRITTSKATTLKLRKLSGLLLVVIAAWLAWSTHD